MAHEWTDSDVELLRKRASECKSAKDIALEFGGLYPDEKWTRNMVIGKAGRVGVSLAKPKRNNRPYIPRQKRPKRSLIQTFGSVPEPSRDIHAPDPVEPPLMIKDVTDGQCRWPHGDPYHEDFRLCGNQTSLGDVYCGYHMAKQGGGKPRDRKDHKTMGGRHTGHLR